MKQLFLYTFCCVGVACSPIKSSPREEKHQLELTLQDIKTQLDEQRRDLSCFQTELKILDGRIKYYEQALSHFKKQELDPHHTALAELSNQLRVLEQKFSSLDASSFEKSENLKNLSSHASETSTALLQFKKRILELEEQQGANLQKDLANKAYKVRSGDSLEKIARLHQTTPKRLRETNHLESDLIVVGQELCIPRG